MVRGLASMDVGSLYHVDATGTQLIMVAQSGFDPGQVERFRVRPLDGSRIGDAVRTGHILVTHLETTPPPEQELRQMAASFEGAMIYARREAAEAYNLRVTPLAAGESARAAYRLPTERRGIFTLGPLEASVTDPFGLAARTLRVAPASELTVSSKSGESGRVAVPFHVRSALQIPRPKCFAVLT